jgi:hypothetical protein
MSEVPQYMYRYLCLNVHVPFFEKVLRIKNVPPTIFSDVLKTKNVPPTVFRIPVPYARGTRVYLRRKRDYMGTRER